MAVLAEEPLTVLLTLPTGLKLPVAVPAALPVLLTVAVREGTAAEALLSQLLLAEELREARRDAEGEEDLCAEALALPVSAALQLGLWLSLLEPQALPLSVRDPVLLLEMVTVTRALLLLLALPVSVASALTVPTAELEPEGCAGV